MASTAGLALFREQYQQLENVPSPTLFCLVLSLDYGPISGLKHRSMIVDTHRPTDNNWHLVNQVLDWRLGDQKIEKSFQI